MRRGTKKLKEESLQPLRQCVVGLLLLIFEAVMVEAVIL